MNTIKLTIDGKSVSAYEGDTLLDAAKRADIYIPTLCHHPLLTNHGACRMCVVEVLGTGRQNLNSACTTPAVDGMEVVTNSEVIRKMRLLNLELIFSERNHQCPFCEKSGDCELQALAYKVGMDHVRFPFLWPNKKVDISHPEIIHDPNRCILCGRCVRANDELDKKNVLSMKGRGIDSDISAYINTQLGQADISAIDKAIQVCPTGALSLRKNSYSTRYGSRLYDTKPLDFLPIAKKQEDK